MSNPPENTLSRFVTGPAKPASADLTKVGFGALDYQDSDFTWEQAIRILKKNRPLALKISGACIALVLLMIMSMKDVYQPVARIEIAPPMSGIRTLPEIESAPEIENQDYLETQTQLLKSDALAVSVIRDLQLDKKAPFTETGWFDKPLEPDTTDAASLPDGDKELLREQTQLATLTPSESRALEVFRDGLSVNPIRNTRLVEVSFSSHNPGIAREVTNTIVAKFIENGYRQRYTAATQVSGWLATQLNDLHQKVTESAQAVSDYEKKYAVVETDEHDVPSSQLLGEVNHQLSQAEATRIEDEAYLRMIDSGQAEFVPPVRDDKVYQDLLSRQADARAQLAQARAVYGDENVNIKKVEEQVAENGKEMDEERSRIAKRIRAAYSGAADQEIALSKRRDELRGQLVNASSRIVGYRMLKNEAIANAELYNTLQARLKEAGIYAGLRSDNVRVVDLAENFQKPAGPHRLAFFALGSLASILVGLVACFAKESLNNTVRTPEDVKAWVGLKSLALLPVMGQGREKDEPSLLTEIFGQKGALADEPGQRSIALMKPLTAEGEAVRDLRTALLSSRTKGGLNVILISSAIEGEGKTTVATNFAIAMAQVGRTCLVDADLRQPMAASAFGVETTPGLSEVLSGSTSLHDALVGILNIPDLWLLPSGAALESPADLLASARMQEICASLRKQFQFVIIDSPPVIRFSDARHLSRLADEVVLVGRYGITTRRAIQRSTELLYDLQAPVAGVVLNGIDYSSPDYHYFTYGYSKAAGRRNASLSTRISDTLPSDTPPPKSKSAQA